jgi:hypothetical protein
VILVDGQSDANARALLDVALRSPHLHQQPPDVLQVCPTDFRALFSALPDSATPQNIGALCSLPLPSSAPSSRTLVIDGLRDPSNAAAVLRRQALHLRISYNYSPSSSHLASCSAAAFSARDVIALEGSSTRLVTHWHSVTLAASSPARNV